MQYINIYKCIVHQQIITCNLICFFDLYCRRCQSLYIGQVFFLLQKRKKNSIVNILQCEYRVLLLGRLLQPSDTLRISHSGKHANINQTVVVGFFLNSTRLLMIFERTTNDAVKYAECFCHCHIANIYIYMCISPPLFVCSSAFNLNFILHKSIAMGRNMGIRKMHFLLVLRCQKHIKTHFEDIFSQSATTH